MDLPRAEHADMLGLEPKDIWPWSVSSVTRMDGRASATLVLASGRRLTEMHIHGASWEEMVEACREAPRYAYMAMAHGTSDIYVDSRYDREGEQTEKQIRELADQMGIKLP